jgi:fatty-acyl-CoA synthase
MLLDRQYISMGVTQYFKGMLRGYDMDSTRQQLTLNSFLNEASKIYPEKEAIVFKNEPISYKQLREKAHRLAIGFKKYGIGKGDSVAVLMPNLPEAIFAYYALPRIGAVMIPLSTRYRLLELKHLLIHSNAKAIMTIDEYLGTNFLDILNQIRRELPNLQNIFVKSTKNENGTTSIDSVIKIGERSTEEQKALPKDVAKEDDVALILYTSGTTGLPKGVIMTHKKILVNAINAVQRLEINPNDIFIGMVPFSHGFATAVLFPHAIVSKAKIVVLETFKAEDALEAIDRHKITLLYGVPAMFEMMMNVPDFKKYDFRSLRTGYMAGAPCPLQLIHRVVKDMRCNISQGYGTTEACGIISLSKWNDSTYHKAETVGIPLPCLEVKIVDDKKSELPSGKVGEIAVRGDSITSGYFKQLDLTSEVFDRDGWFYTGDLGVKDNEGYLKIVGRKKEMIIRGGFNIYPTEIEDHIYRLSGIQYTAVIGIPDKVLGELTCACIIPKSGVKIDCETIIEHCKKFLANYKVPDLVEIMDEFPMTASGKIQKFRLKEIIIKAKENKM